ncbi:MAG TPA: hypothetical protein VNT79_19110, partial [Phycisphaerae bacterium]|nr:hypothetical protein [Phycisphaerae bacterium]
MIQTTSSKDAWLADFEQSEAKSPGDWLRPTRKSAIAAFAKLGFPTTREEDWRFTNVAPIANTIFDRAEQPEARVERTELAEFRFAEP